MPCAPRSHYARHPLPRGPSWRARRPVHPPAAAPAPAGLHAAARTLALALLAVLSTVAWAGPAAAQAQGQGQVPALLRQLEQGDAQTRRRALLGLSDQGDFATVPQVAEALRDPDPVVRELAERALWAIWSRSGDEEVDALFREGSQLLASGRAGESVAVFTRIIERKPAFAEGWNKRATAYYHIGRYEASLKDIAETLERNPHHFGALSGAGLCLIELKRFGEALEYLERALEVNPNLEGVRELREAVTQRIRRPLA